MVTRGFENYAAGKVAPEPTVKTKLDGSGFSKAGATHRFEDVGGAESR